MSRLGHPSLTLGWFQKDHPNAAYPLGTNSFLDCPSGLDGLSYSRTRLSPRCPNATSHDIRHGSFRYSCVPHPANVNQGVSHVVLHYAQGAFLLDAIPTNASPMRRTRPLAADVPHAADVPLPAFPYARFRTSCSLLEASQKTCSSSFLYSGLTFTCHDSD